MTTEWKRHLHQPAESEGLKVWVRDAVLGTIYYAKRGQYPPSPNCGGFYRLSTALWAANVEYGW